MPRSSNLLPLLTLIASPNEVQLPRGSVSRLRSRGNRLIGLIRQTLAFCAPTIVLWFAFAAQSHAQLSTATITGVVRDASGGVVVGAGLVLRNVDTSVERRAQSNTSGDYTFTNVLPGLYVMEASAAGFKTNRVTQFKLEVSQTATIDVSLEVGAMEQSVSVQVEAAAVEAATAELGAVVSTKEVNDLPLNGRTFTPLLSLTPR